MMSNISWLEVFKPHVFMVLIVIPTTLGICGLMDTIENRKNLRVAFHELGQGDLISLETMQFVPGWTSFYVGPGNRIGYHDIDERIGRVFFLKNVY